MISYEFCVVVLVELVVVLEVDRVFWSFGVVFVVVDVLFMVKDG